MNSILIKNCCIILTMNNNMDILYDTNILIENGIIIKISKKIDNNINIEKIIDAKKCLVLPGLCNTHTHIGMTILRGYAENLPLDKWFQKKISPIEKVFTSNTVKISSSLGCLEMIKSGTTSFCDMYYHMDKTAETTYISGLRGCLSYGMIENNEIYKGFNELKKSTKFINKWHNKDNNRIKVMLGPHSPNNCSLEFLEKVKDLSNQKNIGIHMHVLETESELIESKLKYGMCPINNLNKINFWSSRVLAAHCIWMSNDDIDLFSNRKVTVSHNPISNMKLASGIAPISQMISVGVNVTLGSDSCASNNNLSLFEEMKVASLLQKVNTFNASILPAYQVLKMATSNASIVIDNKIGMIKEGYKADLIIIDLNKPHLIPSLKYNDFYSLIVYSAVGSDVRDSIIDGKLIMEDRNILTMDERKIIESSEKEYNKIINKI